MFIQQLYKQEWQKMLLNGYCWVGTISDSCINGEVTERHISPYIQSRLDEVFSVNCTIALDLDGLTTHKLMRM